MSAYTELVDAIKTYVSEGEHRDELIDLATYLAEEVDEERIRHTETTSTIEEALMLWDDAKRWNWPDRMDAAYTILTEAC